MIVEHLEVNQMMLELAENPIVSLPVSFGLTWRVQSRMPPSVPAIMGGKRMDWNYSEIISVEKWTSNLEAQNSLKSTVIANWASRADTAGYKPQGKQTEIITPMWRDATGTLVEAAGAGDPVAYKFSIAGTVVPK